MNGVNRFNGKRLVGVAHLKQSIIDILTTPIGTRVERRDYGSRLFDLIDRPLNRSTIVEIIAATAEAIEKWEKRLKLENVKVLSVIDSKITMTLRGEYLPDGEPIALEGIVV